MVEDLGIDLPVDLIFRVGVIYLLCDSFRTVFRQLFACCASHSQWQNLSFHSIHDLVVHRAQNDEKNFVLAFLVEIISGHDAIFASHSLRHSDIVRYCIDIVRYCIDSSILY